jgi:hypothetical protein
MNSGNSGKRVQMFTDQDNLVRKAKYLIFEVTCGEIQRLLAQVGIPMLVLKGPHVGSVIYEDPAERTYCDLDILVKPEHYYPAARILLGNGFKVYSMNRRRLASEKADYQLLLLAPRGVIVELHRALADRDQFRSDIPGFFRRSEEFTFGALKALGLGTEDLLLHLCLHFGKRHFMTSEKKHLLDIALQLKKRNVDWPVFLDRAKRSGCLTIIYYCLEAARSQYGSEVPREIMKALSPSRWRRKVMDKFLDPNAFPIYRFPENIPGFHERMVNLLLLDRFSTMIFSTSRFAGRSLLNVLLRVGPLRRSWIKAHPLGEWIK